MLLKCHHSILQIMSFIGRVSIAPYMSSLHFNIMNYWQGIHLSYHTLYCISPCNINPQSHVYICPRIVRAATLGSRADLPEWYLKYSVIIDISSTLNKIWLRVPVSFVVFFIFLYFCSSLSFYAWCYWWSVSLIVFAFFFGKQIPISYQVVIIVSCFAACSYFFCACSDSLKLPIMNSFLIASAEVYAYLSAILWRDFLM